MHMKIRMQVNEAQTSETAWKTLYIVGGTAALIAVLIFRRNFGAELDLFRGFGVFAIPETTPSNAVEWFVLFQDDWLVGLLLFALFDLINYGLVGLIFLALYGALRHVNKGAMIAAVSFGFVGIAVYVASNQAFAMLTLSNHYAGATTDAQRSVFLAAGEAILAIHNPGIIYQGTGIYASLFLVLLAGMIISVVMLHSAVFNKVTAYTGLVANFFALGYFLALGLAPAWVWLPVTISAPFRLIWYVLIAVKLFQLAKDIDKR